MKDFESFLNRINFRSIFRIYLIASVLILLLCGTSIAYVMRDKINMAIDYERISGTFERKGGVSRIKAQLDKLSSDSEDILNIIAVDKNNNVIYKANSNLVGENNKFLLKPYNENKKYLQDTINKDDIYKPVKNENIILNRDYIRNHEKILNDISDDFYYEQGLGSKKIDLLNFMINRDTGEKIFVIRTATPIPYAERIVEISGTFIILIGMLYWIGLALWVYRDANLKDANPALWGFIVLITNLVGLIVYIMYKQNSKICQKCGTLQSRESAFCATCGAQINEICNSCRSVVGKNDHFCSKCGNRLE